MLNQTPEVDNYVELSDANHDSYVLHPWTWVDPHGGTPNYVFILPVVALVALISSVFIFAVFLKEKMMTSSTIIMMGIAVSDILTVLSPTPLIIFIYWHHYSNYIPYNLCVIWEYLMKDICAVTHTASVWLSMFLGINRYLGICHPFITRRKCTKKTTIQIMGLIYVLALLFHLCRFLDTDYVPELVENNSTYTCSAVYADWLPDVEMQKTYECIYHWCHIVFITLIPCSVLVILDTKMLRHIWKSERTRSLYYVSGSQNGHAAKIKRVSDSIRTTKIIVTILAIICVLELSLGILLILWTLEMMEVIFVPEEDLGQTSNFAHFAIYISYPFIFLLYCNLSSKFRRGMRKMFHCKKR